MIVYLIGVSTSDVTTSLELCSHWQYKKTRRRRI